MLAALRYPQADDAVEGLGMKILIPVDGSEGALGAVRYVLQLRAMGLRTSPVLVNVQEPASLYEMAVTHDPQVLKELRTSAGAELLDGPESLLTGAHVEFESEVAGGEPVNVLLELAENYGCAAIVMGARGVGRPDAHGLGSVAQGICARARIPVTVVPTPEAED